MSDRSKDIDLQLIAELQKDARQSNVALASAVGLTEGAVRRRIDNLLSSGTLRFTAVADAEYLGLTVQALLRIRCAPHLIDEVIEALSELPELGTIYLCTGEFDITAVGHFGSTSALREFTTNRLGAITGVVEMQSELVLQSFERPAGRSEVDHGSTGTEGGR